jgi:ABC-type dipeptide/oligopeptide/nickel transport system permease subunit
MAGLIIIVILLAAALLAPWIAPYGYEKIDYQAKLAGMSRAHWLGCDFLGRDLLSRMIYGARVSLAVAVVSTLVSLLLGTA